jgi:hypothetical protein
MVVSQRMITRWTRVRFPPTPQHAPLRQRLDHLALNQRIRVQFPGGVRGQQAPGSYRVSLTRGRDAGLLPVSSAHGELAITSPCRGEVGGSKPLGCAMEKTGFDSRTVDKRDAWYQADRTSALGRRVV